MDNLKQKAQAMVRPLIAGLAVAAALMPELVGATCTSMTCGLLVPAGVTSATTGAINTYFFPTIMATVFQQQVIELIVIVAAVMVAWYIVRSVWHRIKMHH